MYAATEYAYSHRSGTNINKKLKNENDRKVYL